MVKNNLSRRKAQVAIFVIIAIVLVAGIAGYFLVKEGLFVKTVPQDLKPAYDYYLNCLEGITSEGVSILGSQGGYIDLPDFEAGSEYSPFSNQLEFFGLGVPYWYYVSGNGIAKEQIPSMNEMESQIENYIESNEDKCDFSEFTRQGYEISLGDASVRTSINDNEINSVVRQSLSLSKGDLSIVINSHDVDVSSNIKGYYEIARGIYDYEVESEFLENYAVDVLYNYAPVTGTEFTCKPLTWNPYDVFSEIQQGLEANVQSLKVKGDYYELEGEGRDYFVVDPGFDIGDSQVNFIYDSDWTGRFEVWPTKNNFMIAEPVGAEQGLGSLGFCYVSYKFVYDVYVPVLIQISDQIGGEVFQFPMAVIVSKNQPKQALEVESLVEPEVNICDNANTEITISTYDNSLSPIEAELEFKCFTDSCNLGSSSIEEGSSVASLEVLVPQCANGLLIANAEGFSRKEYRISTNEESFADIILDKEHVLEVEVFVDGRLVTQSAALTISGVENNVIGSVAYPYTKEISLIDGEYDFDLKVYTEKSITIPQSTQKQCVEVPQSGIGGFIGLTDEECYDYVLPSQTVSNVFYAGGKLTQYISQSELDEGSKLRIYAESVSLPNNIEEVAEMYNIIENKNLIVEVI